MNNERFTVPEVLFNPSDVGVNQMGIAEAIVFTVDGFPDSMRPHFLKNIVLTGGSCSFPGMRDRIYNDVRSLASTDYDIRVIRPEKYIFTQKFYIFSCLPSLSNNFLLQPPYICLGRWMQVCRGPWFFKIHCYKSCLQWRGDQHFLQIFRHLAKNIPIPFITFY